MDSVVGKRVTKVFSQVANRMDKMDARATRVVDALADAQTALADSVADIARKLDALTMAFASGDARPNAASSSVSAPPLSTHASRTSAKRDSSDATLLFFWPVELTRSYAKTTVARVLDERATDAARNNIVVTAPRPRPTVH